MHRPIDIALGQLSYLTYSKSDEYTYPICSGSGNAGLRNTNVRCWSSLSPLLTTAILSQPTIHTQPRPTTQPLDKFKAFTYCSIPSFSSPPPAVVRAHALLRVPPPIRVKNTPDPANFGELWAAHRRPNSFSISPWPSFTQVGRPWLHWPLCGVTSISRSRAFISATLSTRPARTEPWQAMVAAT